MGSEYIPFIEFDTIDGTGEVFAEDNTITGVFTYIVSDAIVVIGSGAFQAGNDVITIAALEPAEIIALELVVYGDIARAEEDATVFAGDDIMDVRNANFTDFVTVYGDGVRLSGTAELYAGNDTIYGARDQGSYIYGDLLEVNGTTATFVAGDDTIYGGDGADTIYGDFRRSESAQVTAGDDTIYGGDGGDTVYADSLFASQVSGGHDVVFGGAGRDAIYGRGGNDRLYSGTGFGDRLFGGDGNDVIVLEGLDGEAIGGDGNDIIIVDTKRFFDLIGGDGTDRVSFYRVDADIVFDLTTNFIAVDGFTDDDGAVVGFENVIGSNTGADRITAGEDANIIKTGGGTDKVFGGGGGDRIELGSGADFVRAGQTGANTYDGGSGVDTLSYSATTGGVRIDLRDNETSGGAAEGDVISGFLNVTGTASGDDTLIGNARGNDFVGLGGHDRLVGFDGNDVLEGRGGDDTLSGGNDNDDLFGGDGADFLDAGRGRDDVYGGAGSDTFLFNKGDDVVIVRDFENNLDLVELRGFTPDINWRDFATQRGDDVWIDFGGGDKLIIKDSLIGWLSNDLDLA